MFEIESDSKSEKPSSRIFLLGLAGAGLLLIVICIFIYSLSTDKDSPILEKAFRAGTSEFDNYKDMVILEVRPEDKITYPNMVGMFQIGMRARMENRGDRTLTGVEVIGKMFHLDGKVLSTNTGTPIPLTRQQPLKPGESF